MSTSVAFPLLPLRGTRCASGDIASKNRQQRLLLASLDYFAINASQGDEHHVIVHASRWIW